MAIGKDGRTLKEFCLCNTHVHTGTKIVVWIQIILTIAILLLTILFTAIDIYRTPKQSESNNGRTTILAEQNYQLTIIKIIVAIVISTIFIFACVFLLYGISKLRPGFYWPYLVIMIISLVILSIAIIALSIYTVERFFKAFASPNDYYNIGFAIGILMYDLILIALFAVYFYFGFVVVRRSKALLDVEVYGPSPVSQPHHSSVYQSEARNKV